MDSDTRYWTSRRKAEDRQLATCAEAHRHRAAEEEAAIAAGLKPGNPSAGGDYYTALWARWSDAWHAAGCPSPEKEVIPIPS